MRDARATAGSEATTRRERRRGIGDRDRGGGVYRELDGLVGRD
jgi:hypothetical protein